MQEQETKRSFGTVNFERREHPRWAIDLPVEYGPIGTFKSRPGRTGDLSEGGLLLYLPEEMEVGQDLWVKLFMGTERELKSIEARVRSFGRIFSGAKRMIFGGWG